MGRAWHVAVEKILECTQSFIWFESLSYMDYYRNVDFAFKYFLKIYQNLL